MDMVISPLGRAWVRRVGLKMLNQWPIATLGISRLVFASVCLTNGIIIFYWTWNNRLVSNRKRSTSRLYIVTLLI